MTIQANKLDRTKAERIQVNMTVKVNEKYIRKERRNGRDVVIVSSATLPDNVVMNRILYPAQTIADGYNTLEGTPAPAGHPMVGGKYISARDPEAINQFWVGAWNENARRDGGRVWLDKIVDVEVAKRTKKGQALMAAIDGGDPIHTSTGLYLEVVPVEEENYDYVAVAMMGDHDAILLDEEGAATPEQGVGLLVNKTERSEIPVMNMSMNNVTVSQEGSMRDKEQRVQAAINDVMEDAEWTWLADWGEDWAIIEAEENYYRVSYTEDEDGNIEISGEPEPVKRVTMWESFQNAAKRLFGSKKKAPGLNTNQSEEDEMAISEEQFQALEAKVDQLVANSKTDTSGVDEALKPLTEKLDAINERLNAEDKEKRQALVDKVVNAKLFDSAEEVEGMTTNQLQKLADKVEARKPGENVFGNAGETGAGDDGGISADLPE